MVQLPPVAGVQPVGLPVMKMVNGLTEVTALALIVPLPPPTVIRSQLVPAVPLTLPSSQL